MGLITTQNDLADFLGNLENARKLNDLVEDIRYALMDYQVRPSKTLAPLFLMSALDFIATRHLQQALSKYCESRSLMVWLCIVICE